MAPKKPSGFMTFMFEWKGKHGRNMNIAQATSAAGEVWSKMTPVQREAYQKRAEATQSVKPKREKLTCLGTPIDFVEREAKEKEKSEGEKLKNIERTVRLALNGKRIEDEKFYFIMVNYFVRLLNSDTYVPAEISVVEFSLKGGVSRKYHTFVNPQMELFGNVYEAQHHSETTHMLPLPPKAKGEGDMHKISMDILSFIRDKKTGSYPPLYTHNKSMGYVNSALSFMYEESDTSENDISKVDIYSIQELFHALKCAVCELKGTEKPRNRFVCDAILEKDVFEYANNIACDYHEEIDRSNYCALSIVYRWGFAFVDFMATDLEIQLLPGYHMPGTVKPWAIMKDSNNFTHSRGVGAACKAMSMLSIDSNYQSCDTDHNQTGVSLNRSLVDTPPKIKPASSKSMEKDYSSKIDLIYTANDLQSSNPWQRHDDSKPPDSRFLSIDYEDEFPPAKSDKLRRVPRGRGFIFLDD